MPAISPEEAFRKTATLCTRKEYCRSEIRQKLLRYGLAAAAHETVLQRLEAEGFLDEDRYARAFAHDKFRHDRWGRLRIRQALRLKGLSSDAIEAALAESADEADYEAQLRNLLRAKARTTVGRTDYERRQKLAAFALRRGFEADSVFRLLEMEEE